MSRRWSRRRRSGVDEAHADDDRPDDDLEERLEAVTSVTSAFTRPPSAEELRAKLTGHRRRAPDAEAAEQPPSEPTFSSQYTTESLFVGSSDDPPRPGESDVDDDGGAAYYEPQDAWAVLGVQPGAAWSTIVAAHRRLALRHHPDRLHDLPTEQRARSEELMREANIAYTTLKRLRSR